jgi:hypothetical protein
MAVKKKDDAAESPEFFVTRLMRGEARLRLIGTMPMYQNRMAEKAKQTLLVGGARKGVAERAQIKHNPPEEFRSAAEILPDGPTALGLKVRAIKGAMAEAALATPGLNKTDVHRFVYIPDDFVPLYGTPYLKMDVVRQAGMNRTPDIRTRAYFVNWAAEITVTFISPQLSDSSVISLLGNAGAVIGIGDNRLGKGGNCGGFRVIGTENDDEEWNAIIEEGRKAQLQALQEPQYVPGDRDTKDLMEFFAQETKRRAAGQGTDITPRRKPKATKASKNKVIEWEPGMPLPELLDGAGGMPRLKTEGV